MILHAVSIRDWKNIGRLELDALDDPLVVLHGPNRTGKSSIVEAIRCCLFDYDHDSNATPIRNAIPWTTRATPEVTVEFEIDGTRYRLMKRFSSRKDGDARFEKCTAGGNWTVVERGKEAARDARTILGGAKSEEGLNQLLWLPQGNTTLPDPKSLDISLRKRFEEVLGSLLTSQDMDFYELLRSHCRDYFSLKTHKELKKSPATALRVRREDTARTVDELSRKVAESESLVRDYDVLQEGMAKERHRIRETEERLENLDAANKAVEGKRRGLAAAKRDLDDAQKRSEQAQAQLDKHSDLRNELADVEQKVREAKAEAAAAEELRTGVTAKITERAAELQRIRKQFADIENQRSELHDMRRLAEIAEASGRLSRTLDECKKLDGHIADHRRRMGKLVTADEKTLKGLRKNRRDAEKLRAEIDAAALRLEIESARDGVLRLSLDSETPERIKLPQGDVRSWQFRQWMELQLESFGTLRVVRGQQDVSLDEAAQKLDRLDKGFADALAGFGIDADDEGWLEKLAARGQQREELSARIEEFAEYVGEIAPDGSEALQRDIQRLEAERQAVLQRIPALSDWTVDADEIRQAEKDVNLQSKQFRDSEKTLSDDLDQLRDEEGGANEKLQELQIQFSTMKEKSKGMQQRLAELGDEFTVKQNLKSATTELNVARKQVEQSALTSDEEQLEQELEQEETALQKRQKRLQETEKQAHGIQERLKDRAGLHEQLAEAEAKLARVQTQLECEELDLAAHRLLLQAFDVCRDQRVQRTVGPLEKQVVEWTARLGLDEYRTMDFGQNDYLPTGLGRRDAETSVSLSEESFGTIEQLSLLIRLAAGMSLAKGERQVAILDDPLTHADPTKHRSMLDILEEAVRPRPSDDGSNAAALQLLVFTCHPERFDHLRNARHINLVDKIQRT